MLGVLAEQARGEGARRLTGRFVPTAKNAPASQIYASHGFREVESGDGESLWELDLTATELAPPDWIACQFAEPKN